MTNHIKILFSVLFLFMSTAILSCLPTNQNESNFPLPPLQYTPKNAPSYSAKPNAWSFRQWCEATYQNDPHVTEAQKRTVLATLSDLARSRRIADAKFCGEVDRAINNANNNGGIDLRLSKQNIEDLFPLISIAHIIRTFDISYTQVKDFSLLKNFKILQHLSVKGLGLQDISWVSDLTRLVGIDLSENSITSLEQINFQLDFLEYIVLDKNHIAAAKDFSYLKNFKNLTYLSAKDVGLQDISWAQDLSPLRWIDLSHNSLTSLEQLLSAQTKLEEINADNNLISSLAFLDNDKIHSLSLRNNKIENLTFRNVTNLRYLYLDNNPLKDLSQVGEITNLEILSLINKGLKDEQKITDSVLLPLNNTLKFLWEIHLSYNKIKNTLIFNGFPKLSNIYLDHNDIVTPVLEMKKIGTLDLTSNKIKNLDGILTHKFLHLLLADNDIEDFTPLLSKLEPVDETPGFIILGLSVGQNPVIDVKNLTSLIEKKLAGLNYLSMDGFPLGGVGDTDFIKNFKCCLTSISLMNTGLSNIEFLREKYRLWRVFLDHNNISDISPLLGKNLEVLSATDNKIKDLSSLVSSNNLQKILLQSNLIEDVSTLKNMSGLNELNLKDNPILKASCPTDSLNKLLNEFCYNLP